MKNEPVDILDEDGNKTGQVLMKKDAHDKGLWHGGAHLWIYNSKGEILLQRRAPNKVVWPNIWDVAVAGHIPAGKTARETMVEEAKEELDLDIDTSKVEYLGEYKLSDEMTGDWLHNVFVWMFITQMEIDIRKLTLEEAETSEVRWVDVDELEKELNDPKMQKDYRSGISKEMFHFAINEVRQRLRR